MTLTFKLVRDIIKVILPAKFLVRTSNGSAVRALTDRQTHRHIDTQTHRTDFIPSTADAGGKNQSVATEDYYQENVMTIKKPFEQRQITMGIYWLIIINVIK